MEIDYTDRIYKKIDAEIGKDKFIRILSKIDKDQNITVEFYYYNKEDIAENGTIKNKRNAYITEKISINKFNEVIKRFPELYPNFKILSTVDYSDLTLKEAIEIIDNFPVYGKIIHFDEDINK